MCISHLEILWLSYEKASWPAEGSHTINPPSDNMGGPPAKEVDFFYTRQSQEGQKMIVALFEEEEGLERRAFLLTV